MGFDLDETARALHKFHSMPMRCQVVEHRGATIINDAYNSNPTAMEAALELIREFDAAGRRIVVCGDMAELGEHAADSHRDIGALARTLGIERVFTFGPLAALAAGSFGAGAERYDNIDALSQAVGGAMRGEVRLLVKGSRGNRLERLVAALAGGNAGTSAGAGPKRRAV